MSDIDALWRELQREDEAGRRKAKSASAPNAGVTGLNAALGSLQVKRTPAPRAAPAEPQARIAAAGAPRVLLDAENALKAPAPTAAHVAPTTTTPARPTPPSAPPATASPSAGGTPSLEDILAARKSQVSVAARGDLLGLRASGADSDDESDGAADDPNTSAPNPATSVGRLVNLIADPSAPVRRDALRQLDALTAAVVAPTDGAAGGVGHGSESDADEDADDALGGGAAAGGASGQGGGGGGGAQLSSQQRSQLSEHLSTLLRPLLLRFADPVEACRDGAVRIASRLLRHAEPHVLAGALPLVLPILTERLGAEELVEPSEEVRHRLGRLVVRLVRACRALLRPHLQTLGSVGLGCCRDRDPGTMRAGHAVVREIAISVLRPLTREQGAKAVGPYTVGLIDAVAPALGHRHAAVRISAIRAITELVPCGGASSIESLVGYREPNVVPIANFYGKGEALVNAFAPLVLDAHVSVRRAFLGMVYRWCKELDYSDLYSQESRLYAYLLSGLFDADPALGARCVGWLEDLGADYEALNAAELKDRLEYGYVDEVRKDARNPPLPPPFARRPRLGARLRVRDHFRRLVGTVAEEMRCWQGEQRAPSAKLMAMLMVYQEEHLTEFADKLVPALQACLTLQDDERRVVAAGAAQCARLLAHHTPPQSYLPLLLPALEPGAAAGTAARVGAARLLTELVGGMDAYTRAREIPGILGAICDDGVVSTADSALRAALGALLCACTAAGRDRAAAEAAAAEADVAMAPVGTRGALGSVAEADEAAAAAADAPAPPSTELAALRAIAPRVRIALAWLMTGAAAGDAAAEAEASAACERALAQLARIVLVADARADASAELADADDERACAHAAARALLPAAVAALVHAGARWELPCPQRAPLYHLLSTAVDGAALEAALGASGALRALEDSATSASARVLLSTAAVVRSLCARDEPASRPGAAPSASAARLSAETAARVVRAMLAPITRALCTAAAVDAEAAGGAAKPSAKAAAAHAAAAPSARQHAELAEAVALALTRARHAGGGAAAGGAERGGAVATEDGGAWLGAALLHWLGNGAAADPAAALEQRRARHECPPLQRHAVACAAAALGGRGARTLALSEDALSEVGRALAHALGREIASSASRQAALDALEAWAQLAAERASAGRAPATADVRAACAAARSEIAFAARASAVLEQLDAAAARAPTATAEPERARVGAGARFEEIDD